jgi:hypothetical protein
LVCPWAILPGERRHADADYRDHNAPAEHKFKIYTPRQKRRLTAQIKEKICSNEGGRGMMS